MSDVDAAHCTQEGSVLPKELWAVVVKHRRPDELVAAKDGSTDLVRKKGRLATTLLTFTNKSAATKAAERAQKNADLMATKTGGASVDSITIKRAPLAWEEA